MAALTLACCAWLMAGQGLWALDVDLVLRAQRRIEAEHEWDDARHTVTSAREEAEAARRRLDAFLSRHFDDRLEPAPQSPGARFEPNVELELRPDAELERFKSQKQELEAHREELLGHLTEEHPQVIYIDERIEAIDRRIASLGTAAREPVPGNGSHGGEIHKPWAEYLERLQQGREQDAAEYQQLYDAWRSAERSLTTALVAENAAHRRWESLAEPEADPAENAPRQSDPAASDLGAAAANPREAEPPRDKAVGGPPTRAPTPSSDSQPLALAALLIALAVAALAAVRLARSTADPLFSSVDEVAAALAIPVVGIIPAAARRQRKRAADTPHRGWLILAAQVTVALAVFAVIAYGVQDPAGLWRNFTHPLEALGGLRQQAGG